MQIPQHVPFQIVPAPVPPVPAPVPAAPAPIPVSSMSWFDDFMTDNDFFCKVFENPAADLQMGLNNLPLVHNPVPAALLANPLAAVPVSAPARVHGLSSIYKERVVS